jgi:hypothetical protein
MGQQRQRIIAQIKCMISINIRQRSVLRRFRRASQRGAAAGRLRQTEWRAAASCTTYYKRYLFFDAKSIRENERPLPSLAACQSEIARTS